MQDNDLNPSVLHRTAAQFTVPNVLMVTTVTGILGIPDRIVAGNRLRKTKNMAPWVGWGVTITNPFTFGLSGMVAEFIAEDRIDEEEMAIRAAQSARISSMKNDVDSLHDRVEKQIAEDNHFRTEVRASFKGINDLLLAGLATVKSAPVAAALKMETVPA
jgi:hypothetical protein